MKKYILSTILCVLAFLNIFAAHVQADSSVIRWGLRYDKGVEIPIGNKSAEYLNEYNSYFHGAFDPDAKVLYLTFDAGYENGHTEKILDTLKENNVPATFFLVGTYLKSNPELIRRMVDEGHIVGNHTVSHADMTTKTADEFGAELRKFEEIYESIISSPTPKYYRPPEGIFNESNLAAASELGYETVLWSATYADWDNKKQPSHEHAFEKLMPRLHPGGIILLHSTSATSTEILGEFIAKCHAEGYEFRGIDEIVDKFGQVWN